MAKKHTAELDQEIQESLARIPKKPGIKTPAQLDAEIDAILSSGSRAERYEIAQALGFRYPKRPPPKKMTLTDTNIFALAELVLRAGGRSTFSNRFESVDYPHIKRCLAGGLVTVSSPTTLTLTPEGKAIVLRRLHKDAAYAAESIRLAQSRGPSYRSDEERGRARAKQIETAITALETGG